MRMICLSLVGHPAWLGRQPPRPPAAGRPATSGVLLGEPMRDPLALGGLGLLLRQRGPGAAGAPGPPPPPSDAGHIVASVGTATARRAARISPRREARRAPAVAARCLRSTGRRPTPPPPAVRARVRAFLHSFSTTAGLDSAGTTHGTRVPDRPPIVRTHTARTRARGPSRAPIRGLWRSGRWAAWAPGRAARRHHRGW